MGIYENTSIIFGVRILENKPDDPDALYIKHEFLGKDWKNSAFPVLNQYLADKNVVFQFLHPATTTFELKSSDIVETIWLNTNINKIKEILSSFTNNQ